MTDITATTTPVAAPAAAVGRRARAGAARWVAALDSLTIPTRRLPWAIAFGVVFVAIPLVVHLTGLHFTAGHR